MRLLRELEAEAADYDTSLLRSHMRTIASVSFVSVSVSECVRPIQFQICRLVDRDLLHDCEIFANLRMKS